MSTLEYTNHKNKRFKAVFTHTHTHTPSCGSSPSSAGFGSMTDVNLQSRAKSVEIHPSSNQQLFRKMKLAKCYLFF